VIKFFQPPRPIGEVILHSTRQLKMQHLKLAQATSRLRQRDQVLFHECVADIKINRKDRASIRANELSEVRKLLQMITQCQLALERVILRLETIKEVAEIMGDLSPALKSLRAVTENLVNVMPDVAHELQTINESISDTLATTHLTSSPESLVPLAKRTEAGEQILKEVSNFLEEKLSEQLPEPPEPTKSQEVKQEVKPQKTQETKKMIALAATCSEISQPSDDAEEPKSLFTYKDVHLRSVTIQRQPQSALEDTVLEYAKSKGEIDVDRCAHELSVPEDEIERALESLDKKQKILIRR
jgi:division protein CdvB (Snf7/Vps24/ESCRT-III family)